MLTSFRLDPELRKRVNAISFFSKAGKSFSEALRVIIGVGINRFEEKYLASVINVDTEHDVQLIAQKHELGLPLSITEISSILREVSSALWSKILLSSETVKSISELFTIIINSRCYSLDNHTLHIFRKVQFIKEYINLSERQYEGPLDIYQTIERKSLDLVEKATKYESCLESSSVKNSVEGMINILSYIATPQNKSLLDVNIFKETIQPYLSRLMQIAKWERALSSSRKVIHACSIDLFFKENNLETMQLFKSEKFGIWIMSEKDLQINASIRLETNRADFSINFYELSELLRINALLSLYSPSGQLGDKVIEGRTLRVFLAPASPFEVKLFVRSASYEFTMPEWQEFCSLLSKLEHEFAPQLLALRTQLGSC